MPNKKNHRAQEGRARNPPPKRRWGGRAGYYGVISSDLRAEVLVPSISLGDKHPKLAKVGDILSGIVRLGRSIDKIKTGWPTLSRDGPYTHTVIRLSDNQRSVQTIVIPRHFEGGAVPPYTHSPASSPLAPDESEAKEHKV